MEKEKVFTKSVILEYCDSRIEELDIASKKLIISYIDSLSETEEIMYGFDDFVIGAFNKSKETGEDFNAAGTVMEYVVQHNIGTKENMKHLFQDLVASIKYISIYTLAKTKLDEEPFTEIKVADYEELLSLSAEVVSNHMPHIVMEIYEKVPAFYKILEELSGVESIDEILYNASV
jgi:hypothetical protein